MPEENRIFMRGIGLLAVVAAGQDRHENACRGGSYTAGASPPQPPVPMSVPFAGASPPQPPVPMSVPFAGASPPQPPVPMSVPFAGASPPQPPVPMSVPFAGASPPQPPVPMSVPFAGASPPPAARANGSSQGFKRNSLLGRLSLGRGSEACELKKCGGEDIKHGQGS